LSGPDRLLSTPPDESFARHHATGWHTGEIRILTPDGLWWRAHASNGENVIAATSETQSETWHRAAEQASSLGILGRSVFP
jgi:hypothetical protein